MDQNEIIQGAEASLQAWKDEKIRADHLQKALDDACNNLVDMRTTQKKIAEIVEDTTRPFYELRAVVCHVKRMVSDEPI